MNTSFLDPDLFKAQFLDLLAPYASRIPLIIFEFGAIPKSIFDSATAFSAVLKPFLEALPKTFRYAIEIRNPDFIAPAYFQLLEQNGVAHVFNAWTHMPPIQDQLLHPDAFTTNFTVTRALLTPGRSYEEAVQTFSPYTELREPNQIIRDALRQVLVRAKLRTEPTYIFVNNRLEGFAPGTIMAVTED